MDVDEAKAILDLTLGTYELTNCSVWCGCPACYYVASDTFTNTKDDRGYSLTGKIIVNGIWLLLPHMHVLYDLPIIWCCNALQGENTCGRAFTMEVSGIPMTPERLAEAYNSQTPTHDANVVLINGCGCRTEGFKTETIYKEGLMMMQFKDPKGNVLGTSKVTIDETGDTYKVETPMKGCAAPCSCICIPYTDTKVYKRVKKPAA